jgi:ribosomal protein L12E/L44/L45/RPP1/RPP2
MTQDDLTKLAKAAGFLVDGDSWIHAGSVLIDGRKSIDEQLKRFANLVAAAQKEADAKLCEEIEPFYGVMFANAIRARGNT